jgi:Short C-terminal domain
MLRRRPVVGRRGPGVVGTVARTALIAGTATATVGAVSGARNRTAPQPQAVQANVADLQANEVQAATTAETPATPSEPTGGAALEQIQQLARLKQDGLLTDAEFETAKAKLLNRL